MKNALLTNKFNNVRGAVVRRDLFVGQTQYGIVRYNVAGVKNRLAVTSEVITQNENVYIRREGMNVTTAISMNRSMNQNEVLSKFVMVKFENNDAFSAFTVKDVRINRNYEMVEVREDGKVFNFTTGSVSIVDLNELTKISFFIYTPSSVKDKAAVFFVSNDRDEARASLSHGGAWAGLTMKITNKALAGKYITRMALPWSGSAEADFYSTVVLYNGFLEGFEDGVKDGEVIVREDLICDLFNLERGQVTFDIQARIADASIAKFKTQAVGNKGFDYTLEHLLARHGFTMAQLEANRVLPVVGEPLFRLVGKGRPDAIVDQNASKCETDIDFEKGCKFLLMAIAKETSSNFNMQLLQKVILAKAEEGKEALELWVEEFKAYIDEVIFAKYSRFLSEFNVDSEEFMKEDYGLAVIRKIDPTNPAVASKIAEDAARAISEMIQRLALPDGLGLNGAVCSDFSAIFTDVDFIAHNEILIGGAKGKVNGKESLVGKKCILQKVPNMFVKEYASLTVVSAEEVQSRVNKACKEGKITEELREVLFRWYGRVPAASFVLPKSKEMFQLIAGMDTDFDKCFLFFNDLIVKPLFGKEEMLLISTKKVNTVKSNSRYEAARLQNNIRSINYDTIFAETFAMVIEHEGLVGKITNENDAIIAMLTLCTLGKVDVARLFIAQNVCDESSTNSKEVFVVPTVDNASSLGLQVRATKKGDMVVINESYAEFIVKEIRACKLTTENIVAFLKCANKVFRLFQEGNIDGAKTSEYVNIIITTFGFVPSSLDKYEVKVELHGDSKYISMNKIERKSTKTLVFDDVMGDIKAWAINHCNTEVFPSMVKQVEDTKYNDEVFAKILRAVGSSEFAYIADEIFTLTSAYNKVYRVSKANQINKDSEGNVGYLHKAVKGLFNKIQSLVEEAAGNDKSKAALMMIASTIMRANGASYSLQQNSTRKMVYTQNPAMAALAYKPQYEIVGNVIAGSTNGVFEFVNGVSTCGNIVLDNRNFGRNKDENGEFVPVVATITDGRAVAVVSPANHKNYKEVNENLGFVGVEGLAPFTKGRNSGCVVVDGVVYVHYDMTKTSHDIIGLADQVVSIKEVRYGRTEDKYTMADMIDRGIYYINDMVTTSAYVNGGESEFVILDLEFEGTIV